MMLLRQILTAISYNPHSWQITTVFGSLKKPFQANLIFHNALSLTISQKYSILHSITFSIIFFFLPFFYNFILEIRNKNVHHTILSQLLFNIQQVLYHNHTVFVIIYFFSNILNLILHLLNICRCCFLYLVGQNPQPYQPHVFFPKLEAGFKGSIFRQF